MWPCVVFLGVDSCGNRGNYTSLRSRAYLHFCFTRDIHPCIWALCSSVIMRWWPLCSWDLLWQVLYFLLWTYFPLKLFVYFCFSQWFAVFPTVTFSGLGEGASLYHTGTEGNHKSNGFFQLRKIANTRRDQCLGVLFPFVQNKQWIFFFFDALWAPWL